MNKSFLIVWQTLSLPKKINCWAYIRIPFGRTYAALSANSPASSFILCSILMKNGCQAASVCANDKKLLSVRLSIPIGCLCVKIFLNTVCWGNIAHQYVVVTPSSNRVREPDIYNADGSVIPNIFFPAGSYLSLYA